MENVNDPWPRRVAILGVGLLGGSVPLAVRRVHPDTRFVGLARSAEKRDRLLELGIVDEAVTSIEEACDRCDVVVVAAPVDRIGQLVVQAAKSSPSDCLITDVGSTKGGIVELASADPIASQKFVAAHPIAGSEKSGPQHASESLFDAKVIVLTPDGRTDRDLVEKASKFWRMTGGVIREMGPAEHDTHLAAISHVPHLVSALVAAMADPDDRPLVGSGWSDMTRIAAGDPTMWTAICQENREAIRHELDRFAQGLERLRELIDREDDEALKQWLAEAQRVKQQIP